MTCPAAVLVDLTFVAEAGIGLWIWSVWSWRLRMDTSFRGKEAKNLLEEFKVYGYPTWVFKLVGAVKTSMASSLILTIIYPMKILTLIGASGMFFLMTVALISHAKVKDPFTKYIPALSMWTLSSFILYALWAGCVEDSPEPGARPVFGVAVAIACICMWMRSFMRGDYQMANYENGEALLKS